MAKANIKTRLRLAVKCHRQYNAGATARMIGGPEIIDLEAFEVHVSQSNTMPLLAIPHKSGGAAFCYSGFGVGHFHDATHFFDLEYLFIDVYPSLLNPILTSVSLGVLL
jgi:hypothetical protein